MDKRCNPVQCIPVLGSALGLVGFHLGDHIDEISAHLVCGLNGLEIALVREEGLFALEKLMDGRVLSDQSIESRIGPIVAAVGIMDDSLHPSIFSFLCGDLLRAKTSRLPIGRIVRRNCEPAVRDLHGRSCDGKSGKNH